MANRKQRSKLHADDILGKRYTLHELTAKTPGGEPCTYKRVADFTIVAVDPQKQTCTIHVEDGSRQVMELVQLEQGMKMRLVVESPLAPFVHGESGPARAFGLYRPRLVVVPGGKR